MRVLGVDPGGAHTGYAIVDDGGTLVAWWLHDRDGDSLDRWVGQCAQSALTLASAHQPDVVAVEGTNQPTGHMGMTSVAGLLDTAWTAGGIVAVCGDYRIPLVVVPPGGHGSNPLAVYPPQLVGERERKGAGRLRHVRSAFDVALAGRLLHRAAQAGKVKA